MDTGSHATPTGLEQVEQIFHDALDRDPHGIDAFLDERCAGDAALRREVEALLAAHRMAGDFIAAPVVTLDARLFDEEPADGLIGQTVGHYQITARIGSGGMGAVYLARRADRQFEKRVAIKLVKRGMDTDSVIRRFHNERQILAGLDHPNIARLLDGGTEGGVPYFVMEYVEGLPIDEYCDRHALPVAARLTLFTRVCAAVAYAHRRAVIHRDLKPSNILVSADGEPKLLDFGIARLLQPGEGAEAVATMMEFKVMTPEYASPEQARGEPLTTVSDVYSLGVVLYRLLAGRPPYRVSGWSSQDLARTIEETEPPRPSAVIGVVTRDGGSSTGAGAVESVGGMAEGSLERLRRRLRGDLDNIVLMALRKKPERRYQSVEQFADDIRRHLETRPVIARADTLAYRIAKFVRRNAVATVFAVLIVLALLGGILATTWQAQRARAQEAIALAEKARAERRFDEVRQLARSVLFEYHDAIKELPGATAVRERLVSDGLRYLDSLAGEATGDPELQRELAAAYERLGDVRGQPYSAASLGDVVGARDSYLKALSIRVALVAAQPHDVQSRRDLARSYLRIGSRLNGTAEAALGLDYLRRGLAIHRELAARQAAGSELRLDLAAAHNDLGLALEDWGDARGALENQRRALALREEFVAADPGNPAHRRTLSATLINLGRALVLAGDIPGGLASNQKSLLISEALFAEHPGNAGYRRLLAIGYQNDGDYRALLGDARGAVASFQRKLVLDEQALGDDPVSANSRADVAYTCLRLGVLLAKAGAPSEALPYAGRAVAVFDAALADTPQDLVMRHNLILSRASVAELHARLDRRADALAEGAKALALLHETPEDPAHALQRSLRGQAYLHLGGAYAAVAASSAAATAEQRQHWRTAREMYARSQQIWQDMQQRGILTGEDATKPREVAREVANCDAQLRKLAS